MTDVVQHRLAIWYPLYECLNSLEAVIDNEQPVTYQWRDMVTGEVGYMREKALLENWSEIERDSLLSQVIQTGSSHEDNYSI